MAGVPFGRYRDERFSRNHCKILVDHPEQIAVTETEEDGIIKIDLTVAPEDMGKVIGKQGRIAKSIRTVVKAAASKGDKKVVVDIK